MSYQLHVSVCSKSVEKSLNQIHLTKQRKEEKKGAKLIVQLEMGGDL